MICLCNQAATDDKETGDKKRELAISPLLLVSTSPCLPNTLPHMITLFAILAAAIPTAIYGMLIWWLDRYEKEPLWLIAVAFLWGSLPAIGLSVLFEVVLEIPLAHSTIGPDLAVWGLAAVVEEPIKAVALIGLFLFMRQEF